MVDEDHKEFYTAFRSENKDLPPHLPGGVDMASNANDIEQKNLLAALISKKIRDFRNSDYYPWSESSVRSAIFYIKYLVYGESIPNYLLKPTSSQGTIRLVCLHDHQSDAILSAYAEAGLELFERAED